MKLNDIEKYIISLFDCSDNKMFAEESGITARGATEIKRIGYCVNLTPDTIEEARNNKVDLMLTHHDAWDDTFHDLAGVCKEKLSEYKISHYFTHLPLDHCSFGTNASLVQKLGLNKAKLSHKYEGFDCGRIAEFDDEKDFEQVVSQMETILNEPVRFWKNREGKVKKVGIVCGGGNDTILLKESAEAGCDTYITGEKNLYTVEYAKFACINLIVGSHTFTELPGIENLAKKVKGRFPDIDVIKLEEKHIEQGNPQT